MSKLKLIDNDCNPVNYDKLVAKEQFDDMVEKFIDLNEDFELSDMFHYMVTIISMKTMNNRIKSNK